MKDGLTLQEINMVQTPHGIKFESNRPVIMGRNGMVCAGQPLAAQAGMAILQKGGNAVDAAIATAAALNVVEPNMSGIGGDGYIAVGWADMTAMYPGIRLRRFPLPSALVQ